MYNWGSPSRGKDQFHKSTFHTNTNVNQGPRTRNRRDIWRWELQRRKNRSSWCFNAPSLASIGHRPSTGPSSGGLCWSSRKSHWPYRRCIYCLRIRLRWLCPCGNVGCRTRRRSSRRIHRPMCTLRSCRFSLSPVRFPSTKSWTPKVKSCPKPKILRCVSSVASFL